MEVSWIPNPICEAFLLNSDLEEIEAGGFDEATAFSAGSGAAVPPILFNV